MDRLQIEERDPVLDGEPLVLLVRVLLHHERLDELRPLPTDLRGAERQEDAEKRHCDANVGAEVVVRVMAGTVVRVADVLSVLEALIVPRYQPPSQGGTGAGTTGQARAFAASCMRSARARRGTTARCVNA